MKRILAMATMAALIAGCNQPPAAADTKTDTMAAKTDSIAYPFKARYSSAFSIGDAANAKTVLALWKAYDDDKLADTKAMWADTVTMEFSGGFTFHGGRDSLLAGGKADREQYSSVVDSVDAWMPLHSTDRNEDWVAVWGREYTTSVKGQKDTADVHEIWQLKNGKVVYMSQYRGKHPESR